VLGVFLDRLDELQVFRVLLLKLDPVISQASENIQTFCIVTWLAPTYGRHVVEVDDYLVNLSIGQLLHHVHVLLPWCRTTAPRPSPQVEAVHVHDVILVGVEVAIIDGNITERGCDLFRGRFEVCEKLFEGDCATLNVSTGGRLDA